MRNLRLLTIDLERAEHPAAPVLQALMGYTNSPTCAESLVNVIRRAAELDRLEEQAQYTSLSQALQARENEQ